MSFPVTGPGLSTLFLGSSVFVVAIVTATYFFFHSIRLTGTTLAFAVFALVPFFSAVLTTIIHYLTKKISALHEQRFNSLRIENSQRISRQLKQRAY